MSKQKIKSILSVIGLLLLPYAGALLYGLLMNKLPYKDEPLTLDLVLSVGIIIVFSNLNLSSRIKLLILPFYLAFTFAYKTYFLLAASCLITGSCL